MGQKYTPSYSTLCFQSLNMAMRFGKDRINSVNIGKSLVYFNDAEEDPEPRYPGKVKPEWKAVKKFFIGHVRQLVLDVEAGRGD